MYFVGNVSCLVGLFVLTLNVNITGSISNVAEIQSKLVEELLKDYNQMIIPTNDSTQPVTVKMGLSFYQVVDVDVKNEAVITHVALQEEWVDYRLQWDPSRFNNTRYLRIPEEAVWLPDIYNFNGVNEEMTRFVGNILLKYDGTIYIEEARLLKTMCRMDMTYFPYDIHYCHIKFGSWSYTEDLLTMELGNPVDFHDFMENGEWELLDVNSAISPHEVLNYDGETFTDVIFSVTFRRKSSFFTVNFVTPSVIVSILSLLSFCLPPNNGEKVNLCVTIVLGLIVFTLVLVNVIPQTAHSITAHYLLFSVVATALAAMASTFTVNVCYKGRTMVDDSATRPVPSWAKRIFINGLARLLCLDRTSIDVPLKKVLKKELVNGEEMTNLADGSEFNKKGSVTRRINLRCERRVIFDEEWYLLASILDRIFLIIFCFAYIAGIVAFLSQRPQYPKSKGHLH